MAYNVICTWRRGCGKRYTLRKHPNAYKVYPRCPSCGRGHLNYDPWTKAATLKRTCKCDGIQWPHKKGLFLDENQICHHAEVDDTFGYPIHVVPMRPDQDVPF